MERDKGIAPLAREEIVHAAKVLAQLNEYRSIPLEGCEGSFGASQMTGFEYAIIIFLLVAFEGSSIAIRRGRLAKVSKVYASIRTR